MPTVEPKEKSSIGGSENPLKTDDVIRALNMVANLGEAPDHRSPNGVYRLFELPFELANYLSNSHTANGFFGSSNRTFAAFRSSPAYAEAHRELVKTLDMDGDGRITPRDLQIMYDKHLIAAMRRDQSAIDLWLPFAGQCVLGYGVGLSISVVARRIYSAKGRILLTGLALYSSFQYLAQQNFLNQQILEEAFRKKVRELADVNGDGAINFDDASAIVDNRMRYISTKLGWGGVAPGIAGYVCLAAGLKRGIRIS